MIEILNMEATRPFLNYIRKFVNITDEEFVKGLLPIIRIRRFGKREFLIKEGEIEDYFNFISKGLIRKYYKKVRLRSTRRSLQKGISF